MMKPLTLEVVSHGITVSGSCARCTLLFREVGVTAGACRQDLNDYPKEMQDEFSRLSEWLAELVRLYRHRIRIRMVDVQSPLGLYKSLRYRIHRYPAFIIDSKDVYSGWDLHAVECLIDGRLKEANARQGGCRVFDPFPEEGREKKDKKTPRR